MIDIGKYVASAVVAFDLSSSSILWTTRLALSTGLFLFRWL